MNRPAPTDNFLISPLKFSKEFLHSEQEWYIAENRSSGIRISAGPLTSYVTPASHFRFFICEMGIMIKNIIYAVRKKWIYTWIDDYMERDMIGQG